jgi:hypothetical protein
MQRKILIHLPINPTINSPYELYTNPPRKDFVALYGLLVGLSGPTTEEKNWSGM